MALKGALRTEPDCSASLQPFWDRLTETVAWCGPRADVQNARTCLREPYLGPRSLEASYFDAVRRVASERRLKLGRTWPRPTALLGGGRLLVYFPDAELSDGAAEAETAGYFDVFNTPPWDTWVAFIQETGPPDSSFANYLISWVPPPFIEAVSRAIDVNPERCLAWLDGSDLIFARTVDRGLTDKVREHEA